MHLQCELNENRILALCSKRRKMKDYNIDVTLEHGAPIRKKILVVLYIGLIDGLLLPLITVGILIAWLAGAIEWEIEMTIVFVLGNVLFIPLIILFIHILIKDKKLKNEIKLWINDVIEVTAYSKTIDVWQPVFYMPKERKIEVRFHLDKMLYTRISTGKAVGGKKGYARFYNKYADRKIRILYSPKYDKVLILKD